MKLIAIEELKRLAIELNWIEKGMLNNIIDCLKQELKDCYIASPRHKNNLKNRKYVETNNFWEKDDIINGCAFGMVFEKIELE